MSAAQTREAAELLAIAAAAARAAGALLAGARAAEVRSKGTLNDLVTEWDLRSEECIRDVLADRAPGTAVLGEEGGASASDGTATSLRWIVDPIDGTVNFAHGLPMWAISIACERAGELVAGVVSAPAIGWWFEASAGGGARDEHGAPLRVSAQTELSRALLATGFPYDCASSAENNFAEWQHIYQRSGSCRRLGSASLDLCMVARGWFDGYWERKLKAWDVAAGALIVAEAGGRLSGYTGGRFELFSGEVIATNGAIHEELLAELGRVARGRTETP